MFVMRDEDYIFDESIEFDVVQLYRHLEIQTVHFALKIVHK